MSAKPERSQKDEKSDAPAGTTDVPTAEPRSEAEGSIGTACADESPRESVARQGLWEKIGSWFVQSRVAKFLKQHEEHLSEFFSPIWIGFVVTCILAATDVANTFLGKSSDTWYQFVQDALTKVKPSLLETGLALICLSLVLSGWIWNGFFKRRILQPLLEFLHHVVMLGAGAVVAVLARIVIGVLFQAPVADAAVAAQAAYGLGILLVAGGQMQFAVWYAKLKEDSLEKILSKKVQSGLGLIGLVVYGVLKLT